jgi:NADH-quinone oxidoreductase subunit C
MHEPLITTLQNKLAHIDAVEPTEDMPTLAIHPDHVIDTMMVLRDDPALHFETLTDLCGVDYLKYGVDDWRGAVTSSTGFQRGKQVQRDQKNTAWDKPRYAVVYHLLSLEHNQRLRIKVYVEEDSMHAPSVMGIWPSADWFEREAYDLFGLVFDGHPDLRRLLTDYGFVGHPFRKDFPMEGHVEMVYDGKQQRCVYQPVSIRPRVNIPKVIRTDSRYMPTQVSEEEHDHG